MNRLAAALCLAFAVSQIAPLSEASEFYISTELGAGFGSSIDTYSSDTDSPTLCDRFVTGNVFFPANPDGTRGECAAGGEGWSSGFGGATGMTAGAALGYRTDSGPRFEVEYFRVDENYDKTSDIRGATQPNIVKFDEGVARAEERIGRITIDSFFANVYYDLPTGRLRPYAGGGAGVGIARIGYGSFWARNTDPQTISAADDAFWEKRASPTGDEELDRENLHRRLAGATSTARKTLRDAVFGYQAVVGVDYALTDKISMGVKGRWVKYSTFKDGGNEYDQLRSHPSNNGDGKTVVYTVETDDMSSFGVSVVMKYAF